MLLSEFIKELTGVLEREGDKEVYISTVDNDDIVVSKVNPYIISEDKLSIIEMPVEGVTPKRDREKWFHKVLNRTIIL